MDQTIFARTTGNDTSGKGTLDKPYRTFQRAVQDVPSIGSPDTKYFLDITGIGTEILPAGYILPAWKSASVFETVIDRFWVAFCGVNIQATPQPVAAIPLADTVVTSADILLPSVVPDPVTQLITVPLKVARPSWGANALKGKLVVGKDGGQENCVIWESDTTFIRITNTVIPSRPFDIMEPSAHLDGPSLGQFRGAINAYNVDSIAFNGIKITTSTPSPSGLGLVANGYGQTVTQLCELESPAIATLGTFINRTLRSWVYGDPLMWGRFAVSQCLMDAITANPVRGPAVPQFRQTVFNACVTLEIADQLVQLRGQLATTVPYFRMDNCLVRNTPGATGDGIRWHGSKALLNCIDVHGCGRDGIRCELGAGIIELLNVRTTGPVNAGNGITITDGMFAKVDAATSGAAAGTQLRGATGEMKVGTGAVRTWANFVSGADGRPALNEYDITAAAPTGATGTGSRLFQ